MLGLGTRVHQKLTKQRSCDLCNYTITQYGGMFSVDILLKISRVKEFTLFNQNSDNQISQVEVFFPVSFGGVGGGIAGRI